MKFSPTNISSFAQGIVLNIVGDTEVSKNVRTMDDGRGRHANYHSPRQDETKMTVLAYTECFGSPQGRGTIST